MPQESESKRDLHLGTDTSFVSISTFSGGGIGDIGIEWGCGLPVISACELISERAGLIRHNFPQTKVFNGDIKILKDDIVRHAKDRLANRRPWLVVMSPPCQGMSSNGAGRISKAIKEGKRPKLDERNRLVIPGIDIVEALQPDWFILENVKRMENTVILNEFHEPENILALLGRRLHPLGYTIRSSIIDFQGLGVPQNRQRLITIGTRLDKVIKTVPQGQIYSATPTDLHPKYTHGKEQKEPYINLKTSIGHLPPLDAQDKLVDDRDPIHQIPRFNPGQYFWIRHTPEGKSAFENNVCVSCGNIEPSPTVVQCTACQSLLPKPQIEEEVWSCICGIANKQKEVICNCGIGRPEKVTFYKRRRLIKGFKTSYRRLKWNMPASTITMNSGVISSDMKGHPEQNRVLSVRELLILSTLESHPGVNYPWSKQFSFKTKDEKGQFIQEEFNPKLVRKVLGESIPPLAMAHIVQHLIKLDGRILSEP